MRAPRVCCRNCGQPFNDANVHSEAGWIETRISGFCEDCFDAIFAVPARDDYDDGRTEEGNPGTGG